MPVNVFLRVYVNVRVPSRRHRWLRVPEGALCGDVRAQKGPGGGAEENLLRPHDLTNYSRPLRMHTRHNNSHASCLMSNNAERVLYRACRDHGAWNYGHPARYEVEATQDTIILHHHLESTAIDHMFNHLNARDEFHLGRRASSTAQTPVHLGYGGG
jgi:hypothetical protein